jgi:hypothetical protein
LSNSIKVCFKLKEDELGPFPISAENLWCHIENGYYKIKNIPMFVTGLAVDDLIDIKDVGDNKFQMCEMIESSGNSTVWMQVNVDASDIVKKLRSFGCQIEGGAFKELFAINVPGIVNWEPIGRYLDSLDVKNEIVFLYASFNHDE